MIPMKSHVEPDLTRDGTPPSLRFWAQSGVCAHLTTGQVFTITAGEGGDGHLTGRSGWTTAGQVLDTNEDTEAVADDDAAYVTQSAIGVVG